MKSQFLKIKDNNTKTGRVRKSWQNVYVMEEILEKDRCVNPTSGISSIIHTDNNFKFFGQLIGPKQTFNTLWHNPWHLIWLGNASVLI
jgi:hypothetical protein